MPGKVAFIFDDGYASAYSQVAPLFESKGFRCGFAVGSKMRFSSVTEAQLLELQVRGHEILNHGRTHQNMSAEDSNTYLAYDEIIESLEGLEEAGMFVRSYVAANSVLAESHIVSYLAGSHMSGYTVYSTAAGDDALQAVPLDPLRMHRTPLHVVGLAGAMQSIDSAIASDGLIVFYDHDPAQTEYPNSMPLAELAEVLDYCIATGVEVMLPTDAVESKLPGIRQEFDREKIIRLSARRQFANILPDPDMISLGSIWKLSSSTTGTFSASGATKELTPKRTLYVSGAKKSGAGSFVFRNDRITYSERNQKIGSLCFSMELKSGSAGVNENFEVSLAVYARNAVGGSIVLAKSTGALYLDSYSRRYFVVIAPPQVSHDIKLDCFLKILPLKTSSESCSIVVSDPRLNKGTTPNI